jgi:hypothetical protein
MFRKQRVIEGIESIKKVNESILNKLSNMSVQYYYKIVPKPEYTDKSAQYVIDNINTFMKNKEPMCDYIIIGKVITLKLVRMASSLEAFIILKETEDPTEKEENDTKMRHFIELNFNKELTKEKKYNFNDEPMEERTLSETMSELLKPTKEKIQHVMDYPTLYNYLFELPEFELEDNGLVLYTIYNKRFYDEI